MKAIARWLAPPVSDDEGTARQANLIYLVAVGFLALAVAIFIGNMIGGKTPYGVKVINVIAFCLMLPVLAWLHRGRLALAQGWLLVVTYCCLTGGIASLGSIRAPIASLYLAGVIISGLLFDRKGVVYSSVACSVSVMGLIWAENAGFLPLPDRRVGLPQWVTYTTLFAFTGTLIYSINRVTKDALARAEKELEQRKRTEISLNTANEKLKQRVHEVELLQQELRELTHRDGLTGLHNRRYLADAMEREVARAMRDQVPLSVVMVDVDHFKAVNDSWGHQVGDAVLVRLAKLLTSSARGSDIVCRYGGEEFLLVFIGTTLDLAQKRAEDIRGKADVLSSQLEGNALQVTLSFGVASLPVHGKNWEEVVSKADKALYQSKRDGRNRVTVWPVDVVT